MEVEAYQHFHVLGLEVPRLQGAQVAELVPQVAEGAGGKMLQTPAQAAAVAL
jgi:hypothetical protein